MMANAASLSRTLSLIIKSLIICTFYENHITAQVQPNENFDNDPEILRETLSDPRSYAGWSTKSPYSPKDASDFYSFTVVDINGNDVPLSKFRGKISLVVNVASQCGFTDNHYKALVKLQEELLPTGRFSVLAFPCNQFGGQEPWSHDDILRFVKTNYGINFPMFSKINVISQNVSPAFQFLVDKSGQAPNWNFWKYLVNENGQVISASGPQVSVEAITEKIRQAVHQASYGTHQEF